MKKLLLALLLALVLTLTLAACDDTPAENQTEAHVCEGKKWTVTKAATCTEKGEKAFICKCGETVETAEIPATGHTEEVLPTKDATCTASGLTEGKKCSVCDVTIVERETVPATGHTEEVIPAIDATCTTSGLKEGKRCSVCGMITVPPETVPAIGHNEEVIPAKEATYTETGLTEGKKCSVCGEILVAQEEIPVKQPVNEVTAEQWVEIMSNIDNFTFEQMVDIYYITPLIIKVDGNKLQMPFGGTKGEDGSMSFDIIGIIEKNQEIYDFYWNIDDGNGWQKALYRETMNANAESMFLAYTTLISVFKDDYSLYTYADGIYTAINVDKTGSLGVFDTVKVTFENGALIAIEMEYEETIDGETVTNKALFKDIGTTTVEIPTEYTEYDPKADPPTDESWSYTVTAEQWDDIMTNANNFTIEFVEDGTEYVEKTDGNKFQMTIDNGMVNQIIDGDEYSLYVYDDEEKSWIKVYASEDEIATVEYGMQSIRSMISVFKDDYSLFTYADGVYIANNVTKTMGMAEYAQTFDTVKITFGNGALIAIEMEYKGTIDGETVTNKMLFKDIGTTTVEIPTEYTEFDSD